MDAIKLLSSLLKNNSLGSNVLGGLLGGGGAGQTGGGGGALGALGNTLRGGRSGGGLGALASILGGGAGLTGLFGGGGGAGGGGGLMGNLMGMIGGGRDEAEAEVATAAPPEEAQVEAELLIRAMCNAAKADGRLDDAEKQNIIGRLGEVTQDEIDFVQSELAAPLDVDEFVASVPRGSAEQVYSFSVMAIKLDEQSEANYLGKLAQGLGISADTANQIHQQLGAPQIFA